MNICRTRVQRVNDVLPYSRLLGRQGRLRIVRARELRCYHRRPQHVAVGASNEGRESRQSLVRRFGVEQRLLD